MTSSSLGLCAAGLLAVAGAHLFFVCCAAAIRRARGARLRELEAQHFLGARAARAVIARADRYALAASAGVMLSSLFMGCLLTLVFEQLASSLSPAAWIAAGAALLLAVTALMLILAQGGKALVYAYPAKALSLFSYPLRLAAKLLRPITAAVMPAVGRFVRSLELDHPNDRERALSAPELAETIRLSERSDEISSATAERLTYVLQLRTTLARQAMTPRADVVAVPLDVTREQLSRVFAAERVSRVLVVGEGLDDVRGVLVAKDFLRVDQGAFDLSKLLRPAHFVREDKPLDEVLDELRRHHVHLAVVLDHHGGMDGVISLEDVIEEIVGEILDESDVASEEERLRRTAGGDLLVDGRMKIEELNERLPIGLAKGEYVTVAGYFLHVFGRIPKKGDSIEHQGFRLQVEELDDNRLNMLRITAPRLLSALRRPRRRVGANADSLEPIVQRSDSNQESAGPGAVRNASGSR